MTRKLAHSYEREVARPVQQATPLRKESPWALLAQIVAAAIVSAAVIYVLLVILTSAAVYR